MNSQSKIVNALLDIPHDKLMHALFGVLIFAVGRQVHVLFGLALVAFFAIAKEISDYYDPEHHTCDWRDAVATMAGGLLGWLCQFNYPF